MTPENCEGKSSSYRALKVACGPHLVMVLHAAGRLYLPLVDTLSL